MNSSAYDILTELAATLPADADVDAFCQARYGKALTGTLGIRKRDDVLPEDCPLLMITRPETNPENLPAMRGKIKHTVNLYLLLHQPDPALALEETVKLEELIDQALSKDITRGGRATNTDTSPGSANDEGAFHPMYAVVKVIRITQNVSQLAR